MSIETILSAARTSVEDNKELVVPADPKSFGAAGAQATGAHSEPFWSSVEEVLRLEREDPDAARAGYEASWLTR